MKKLKIVDGWEMIPADSKTGLFMEETWKKRPERDRFHLTNEEQQIIHDMLKLFVRGHYGYYFSELHDHEQPEDIPVRGHVDSWTKVYYTPNDLFYDTGQYNSIDTASTKDYVYYAISLNGSSLASALTEYVRIPKVLYEEDK